MEDVVTGVVLLSAKKDCVDDVERFVELLNRKKKFNGQKIFCLQIKNIIVLCCLW
jgi:hypothetical protein